MKVFAYEGAWQIDHIVIVGVGGTGSALARLTARMLWQRGQMGQSVPELYLIDPDVVELKNVIRQSFAVGDVDSPKARAIALRYSLAYGLPIQWVAEAFDPDKHLPRGSILVDCTDNHEARRAIVKGIEQEKCVCLSNGNHTTFGQTILGGEYDRDKLEAMIVSMDGRVHSITCRILA